MLKADVAGSLEALADEIVRLPQEQVQVNIIREGVGGIAESDVMLAAASDGIVIGFNVRPVGNAAQVADREGVEIRTYSVIYNIVEELRDAMEGLLDAKEVEEAVGTAEVRATFKASRVGTIAGCYVTDGRPRRGVQCRLVRDGTVVYDGRIGSLRRFKDDVREVTSGMECGIVLENYPDPKEGDVIEAYETKQVEQTLPLELRLPRRDPPPLPRQRKPEGQAKGAQLAEGPAAAPLRRGRRGDRPSRPLAALRADRRASRRGRRNAWCASAEAESTFISPCFLRRRLWKALVSRADLLLPWPTACAGSTRRSVRSSRHGSPKGLRDPRIGFVTVTAVDTSPDLRRARVYVSVLGDDERGPPPWPGSSRRTGCCSRRSP